MGLYTWDCIPETVYLRLYTWDCIPGTVYLRLYIYMRIHLVLRMIHTHCVYLRLYTFFCDNIQAQPRLYSCLALLSSPSPEHVNYTVSGTLYFTVNC